MGCGLEIVAVLLEANKEAAAHRDTKGMLPLALAAHVGAPVGVKELLFEAHPEATEGAALHEVLCWGAGAVTRVLGEPEVILS